MAAKAHVEMEVNAKELEARSPEEKRLLALSKLGKEDCVVGRSC